MAAEISRFLENKALAVAFLNRELGAYSRFPAPNPSTALSRTTLNYEKNTFAF